MTQITTQAPFQAPFQNPGTKSSWKNSWKSSLPLFNRSSATNQLTLSSSAKLLFSFFLAALLLASTTVNALAQLDQQSLIAIPPRRGENRELVVNPGEKIQTDIRVKNNSNQTLSLKSYARDFIVGENGRTPIPVDQSVSNRWSLASWMAVVPNQHELGPNETAQINIVIEVPDDALPGGHYAMVLHQPTNNEPATQDLDAQEAVTSINQMVGTLFYVIVDGPINEEAYITDFKFNNFQEFGPVPFSFKVSNQSDIHIKPRMEVDIFNLIGQKVDSIKVEPRNIFPLTSLNFNGKWEKVWGFGLYKAKLTLSYGENGQVVMANTNFWIIPVRIVLAILFILLTLSAIIVSVRSHIRHKTEQEEAKIKELQQKLEQYEGQNKPE
ncbi:MAG: hypothetical protein GF381_01395 [Candidatus Pacebacteria bacterium]|nr:hypothetical protein [Candidatus Paceibacterota bacterium]